MESRVRKWRQWSWGERWLVLQAVLLLPVIALGVRLAGYQRVRGCLAWTLPQPRPANDFGHEGPADVERATTIGRLVNGVAAAGPFRANCLSRSLLVWWLLGRRGIASEVMIGGRLDQGEFQAHAWVECRRRVVNDRLELIAQFHPFGLAAPVRRSAELPDGSGEQGNGEGERCQFLAGTESACRTEC